jgi:hypothetical protein
MLCLEINISFHLFHLIPIPASLQADYTYFKQEDGIKGIVSRKFAMLLLVPLLS